MPRFPVFAIGLMCPLSLPLSGKPTRSFVPLVLHIPSTGILQRLVGPLSLTFPSPPHQGWIPFCLQPFQSESDLYYAQLGNAPLRTIFQFIYTFFMWFFCLFFWGGICGGFFCGGFFSPLTKWIWKINAKSSNLLLKQSHLYIYFHSPVLGSEYLYTEFCNNNLTPLCSLPARNASVTLTLSSNMVYLAL